MKNSYVLKVAAVALTLFTGTVACGDTRMDSGQVAAARANPIVEENQEPGTGQWQVPWPGHRRADDTGMQIKGFAARSTVRPGGSLTFKVTTRPAQAFSVDIFRLGYYGGMGGRLMYHIGQLPGIAQPACVSSPDTGLISCANWLDSITLDVPKTWLSGVYVAVLTNERRYQSIAPFWVTRPNRRSDLLFLSSLNTYQAYNDFPYDPPAGTPDALPQTGKSLYPYNSSGNVPATRVSFDRPFSSQYGGSGVGGLYDFEPHLIQFLEKSGYDVTYANDVSLDARPSQLLNHKTVVIAGHAEYWTKGMYDAAVTARAAGVGLAFISANEIYWQVRYEKRRRVLVGYKDFRPDPIADPSLRTIRWRDLGRPEQKLIGVQFPTDGWVPWGGQPYVPKSTTHWAYQGTGMAEGAAVDGEIVGYEIDAYDPAVGPPEGSEHTLLAASPFVNIAGRRLVHNSSIYLGQGGNYVWATGTMNWAWALSPGLSGDTTNVRPQLQAMTVNVLNTMIATAPQQPRGRVAAEVRCRADADQRPTTRTWRPSSRGCEE